MVSIPFESGQCFSRLTPKQWAEAEVSIPFESGQCFSRNTNVVSPDNEGLNPF